jgi:hypothetical protein
VLLFRHDPNNPNTLSSNAVIGKIIEDGEGNLYLGTRSDGLINYHYLLNMARPVRLLFIAMTKKTQLPSATMVYLIS